MRPSVGISLYFSVAPLYGLWTGGTVSSVYELSTGKSPLSGDEASRPWAVVGLIPYARNLKHLDEVADVARGVTGIGDDAVKWIWSHDKGAAKSIRQMAQRGWVPQQVTEAIRAGQQFPATNLVNKANPAIRYVHPTTGQSIVQDTTTKEIIHFGGEGFKY